MKSRKGFTLIELTLAIAFVGILSITVAVLINNAVKTYRWGLTLNQVNTVGMDLVDDMRTAVQNASAKLMKRACSRWYRDDLGSYNECVADDGEKLVEVIQYGSVPDVGDDVPLYGAFCTGAYTYIWNSGYYFGENAKKMNVDNMASLKFGAKQYEKFKLLKVQDATREICANTMRDNSGAYYYDKDRVGAGGNLFESSGDGEDPIELISEKDGEANSDAGLALYSLSVEGPAQSEAANSIFYLVSFILGTIREGININQSGNFCKAPAAGGTLFDYCAINKFNFAARATGG